MKHAYTAPQSKGRYERTDDAAGPQLAWIISHEGKVGLSRDKQAEQSKAMSNESMRWSFGLMRDH